MAKESEEKNVKIIFIEIFMENLWLGIRTSLALSNKCNACHVYKKYDIFQGTLQNEDEKLYGHYM